MLVGADKGEKREGSGVGPTEFLSSCPWRIREVKVNWRWGREGAGSPSSGEVPSSRSTSDVIPICAQVFSATGSDWFIYLLPNSTLMATLPFQRWTSRARPSRRSTPSIAGGCLRQSIRIKYSFKINNIFSTVSASIWVTDSDQFLLLHYSTAGCGHCLAGNLHTSRDNCVLGLTFSSFRLRCLYLISNLILKIDAISERYLVY